MSRTSVPRLAPGGPGIEPRWTLGAKTAVGTAYSTSSRVWYTLDCGCVTEVYYPTIDSPQIRDLQFLTTDGESFFHDERRSFVGQIACLSEAALGVKVTNREKQGRYSIHKTILGDPHQNCLLIHTRLEAPAALLPKLRMYVLCAPHLEIGGWHNNGEVLRLKGHTVLAAHKGNTWLVIGATVPFTDCSCGYVGVNDGWTDLADNYRLDWQYEAAFDGNIALIGGLDLSLNSEFTVGVSFGTTRHDALSSLAQSLSIPFERTRDSFIHQWARTAGAALPLLWAHAEYMKLQRSASDGKIFDLIEAAYDRYVRDGREHHTIEVWKFNRQVPTVAAGTRLRIQANSPFLLHWTSDEWQHSTDTRSKTTGVGIEFVDIQLPEREEGVRFTFLWLDDNRWEEKDYTVQIQARADSRVRRAAYGRDRAA